MVKRFKFSKKTVIVVLLIIGTVIFLLMGPINAYKERKKSEAKEYSQEVSDVTSTASQSEDSVLMKMQKNLIKSYGDPPDNYVWNTDGTLLSLGDKSMSAEEVVYSYLNGLSSLDFSTVQKFSRNSSVVKTYQGYFDETDKNTDYKDSFIRNMYRECLLSIQTEGIINTSVFAENKQVFTIKLSMLDLTQKDFWEKDKETIYKNLKIYNSDQSDSTKAEMYLYDYISRYYSGGNAQRREVTFDITLQKYPDLDTGWLVSIDTDVDSACRYADGKLVVNYIQEMYIKYGIKYLDKLEASKEAESSN